MTNEVHVQLQYAGSMIMSRMPLLSLTGSCRLSFPSCNRGILSFLKIIGNIARIV